MARLKVLGWRLASAGGLLIVSFFGLLVLAQADSGQLSSWTSPTAMAIKQVSAIPPDVGDFSLAQPNLPCSQLSYHPPGGGSRSGCFTETAFGLMDGDDQQVNFFGSSGTLPMKGVLSHEILLPMPYSADVLSFTPAVDVGSYFHLYTYFPSAFRTQTDLSTGEKSVQVTAQPNLTLRDPSGQPLAFNAQTIAYSSLGSWLVAESQYHAFMRINTATLDMLPFAPSFTYLPFDITQHNSQVAVGRDGRFVAIGSNEIHSLKIYDLSSCQGAVMADLRPLDCASYEYWPFLAAHITDLTRILAVNFLNDGLLSLSVLNANGTGGTYELAPADSIDSLLDYLGTGDSYTSGEGAYNYLSGTDTEINMCHLSLLSYPLLLTHDLFSPASGNSVACSGAVIGDITPKDAKNYRGQTKDGRPRNQQTDGQVSQVLAGFRPGNLAQAEFVGQYQPRVVSVSVGGNDIGFGSILERCVAPHLSVHPSDQNCFSSYEDRLELLNLIDRTVPKLTALYKQLLKQSPGSRLYVVGYPQIALESGDCGANVHLARSELQFAAELLAYLNGAVERAASSSGVRYVDISQALTGHRLCETTASDIAVNGLTAGKDAGFFGINFLGKESYHPNALGQALMEQAILRATHNLTDPLPPADQAATQPASGSAQALLQAPRTNRTVRNLFPDPKIAPRSAIRGNNLTVSANGLDDGLAPNTSYSIGLDGSIMASVISASNSNISAQITIPAITEPGIHTITINGLNQVGEPSSVVSTIYVSAGSSSLAATSSVVITNNSIQAVRPEN